MPEPPVIFEIAEPLGAARKLNAFAFTAFQVIRIDIGTKSAEYIPTAISCELDRAS